MTIKLTSDGWTNSPTVKVLKDFLNTFPDDAKVITDPDSGFCTVDFTDGKDEKGNVYLVTQVKRLYTEG